MRVCSMRVRIAGVRIVRMCTACVLVVFGRIVRVRMSVTYVRFVQVPIVCVRVVRVPVMRVLTVRVPIMRVPTVGVRIMRMPLVRVRRVRLRFVRVRFARVSSMGVRCMVVCCVDTCQRCTSTALLARTLCLCCVAPRGFDHVHDVELRRLDLAAHDRPRLESNDIVAEAEQCEAIAYNGQRDARIDQCANGHITADS